MTVLQAIILAIIEGITEFLPVSSTGHMIIGSTIMGIEQDEFVKLFTVAIQFGTILSVVALYWKRFFQSFDFYLKLLAGFIPAVISGLLFKEYIDLLLENVVVVGVMLFLGGIFFLVIDRLAPSAAEGTDQPMSFKQAATIGVWQCLAMVPGTSRSGATIIGGMLLGLSRKAATDYSFFLAMPTLIGAGVYSLYKERALLSMGDAPLFAVGLLFSFLSAWVCVRWLLRYISSHSFVPFAWYRIVFGAVVLLTAWGGWVTWAA